MEKEHVAAMGPPHGKGAATKASSESAACTEGALPAPREKTISSLSAWEEIHILAILPMDNAFQ